MKRIISAILVLMLCFSLCACEAADRLKSVELPPVPTVTPTNAPTESTAEGAEQMPLLSEDRVIVTFKHNELEALDPQNGTRKILSFSWDTPCVCIDNNPEAETRINEYIAMLDESYYTGEDYGDGSGTGYNNMLTSAEDYYNFAVESGDESMMRELASDRSFTVQLNNGAVLTLLANAYTDLGGAHGSYVYRAYGFDASTGELLTLDNITADKAALCDFLTAYMVETAGADEVIRDQMVGFVAEEDFESALSALLREGSWYFGKDGMIIFSDIYELCSYAAGIVSFTVPYEMLSDYVDEKYIPEPITADGGFTAVAAGSMPEGSIEIIDMLRENEDGQTLYLVAAGEVREVSVCAVEYADYANTFYDTAELWSCSRMTDCALQLRTDIPDGIPHLMLRYRTADGEHRLLLSQSGEDGGLLLIPESDITAVG